jgi:hypothetical protein
MLKPVREQSSQQDGAGSNARVGLRRPLRAAAAIVLLLPYLTGCYTYAQPGVTPVPVGSEVEVSVSDTGRTQLAELIGPGVRRVHGRVMQSSATSLVLAVSSVEHQGLGAPVSWAGQQVAISEDMTADVRVRTLSRSRSYIAAGLAVLGAALVALIVIAGFGTDDGAGDRPLPEPPVQQ